MLGLAITTDAQYAQTWMEFCGEYRADPDEGISIEWLKSWVNDQNGDGYISGAVLHNFVFGVRPRPARAGRKTPSVTHHPVDMIAKPVAKSTASSSTTPPMIFPPLPPGLPQPISSATTPSLSPPVPLAPFPVPPSSLQMDPYEIEFEEDTEPEE